jgi:heme exporter protein C
MHRFANPARFLRLSAAILPWVTGLTVVLFALGIYLALFVMPADYQQGDTVKILVLHVSSAWMALEVYVLMAMASAVGLIYRHPLADLMAKASAPVGAGFTALALATGSLWGKPEWGAWWVWDARTTSVVILLFLYLGYIALWEAFDDREKAAKAAAIVALVGVVNVPIIHFSVNWWNTLHQPASVFRIDGPHMAGSMLIPLMVMAFAFEAYFLMILLWRVRAEIAEQKVRQLRIAQAGE